MGRRSDSGGVRESRGKVQLDFTWCGKRLKPTLNLRWNERNRRAALRLVEEISGKIRHGVFNPAEYFPDYRGLPRLSVPLQRPTTFGELADRWLQTLGNLTYASRTDYARLLDRYWRPEFDARPIAQIKYSDLVEVFALLAKLKPKTRNNALIPLRAVFEFAMKDKAIAENPAALLENSTVQHEEPDPLRLDEAEAILADLLQHHGEQVRNYFETAFFTGLRPSEQIAVGWADFGQQSGELRIHRARVWGQDKDTTKTHQIRTIELLDRAQGAIVQQKAHTFLAGSEIFHNPNTKRPWADEQVQRRMWNASLKRLGIRHREQYQTRHTFATFCIMAGGNPAWIARQMGHRTTKMLFEVYSKWIERADRGRERGKVNAGLKTNSRAIRGQQKR